MLNYTAGTIRGGAAGAAASFAGDGRCQVDETKTNGEKAIHPSRMLSMPWTVLYKGKNMLHTVFRHLVRLAPGSDVARLKEAEEEYGLPPSSCSARAGNTRSTRKRC